MSALPPPAFPVPRGPALLEFAERICKEYREKGYAITLRQLYYQGVARGFLPSGPQAYDALKRVISKARLDGKFPLWAIVDRTRYVRPGKSTRCDTKVERALVRSAAEAALSPERFLHRDPWFGQENNVSVWFEKEALAGIFEAVCEEQGVASFSCRGDPSHPVLYDWLKQAAAAHGVDNPEGWKDKAGANHKGMAKRSVVLYFGDHDPTGIRIPRTAEETIRTFMDVTGLGFDVEFRRIGLTLEQARDLRLPPFWAKESAGKDYDNYVEEFGTTDAWELDALSPETLERMVREAVSGLFDADLHARLQDDVLRRRREMRAMMKNREWHAAATNFEG